MDIKAKKGISVKGIFTLILISVIALAFTLNVYAETKKKEVDIIFPEIAGVDRNNKTFAVYDITELRKKVRVENSDLEYNKMLNKLKLRAERMPVGSDKKEILKDTTKKIGDKDGVVNFKLEDDKTYIIENLEGRTEPILLDYVYGMPDKQEIFAKPVPFEEKIPLKKSGLNKNIFAQVKDFINLILN